MMTDESIRAMRRMRQRLGRTESTPRLLYLEGTYTPTYLGATTAGVTTYTVQAGFYTQIGRVVFFNGRVVWTAATGTGAAIVSLPFTSDPTTNMRYGVMLRVNGVTFANGSVEGNIQPNVAFFSMESPLTNAAPTAINVEAAGDVIFSGFFFV